MGTILEPKWQGRGEGSAHWCMEVLHGGQLRASVGERWQLSSLLEVSLKLPGPTVRCSAGVAGA